MALLMRLAITYRQLNSSPLSVASNSSAISTKQSPIQRVMLFSINFCSSFNYSLPIPSGSPSESSILNGQVMQRSKVHTADSSSALTLTNSLRQARTQRGTRMACSLGKGAVILLRCANSPSINSYLSERLLYRLTSLLSVCTSVCISTILLQTADAARKRKYHKFKMHSKNQHQNGVKLFLDVLFEGETLFLLLLIWLRVEGFGGSFWTVLMCMSFQQYSMRLRIWYFSRKFLGQVAMWLYCSTQITSPSSSSRISTIYKMSPCPCPILTCTPTSCTQTQLSLFF